VGGITRQVLVLFGRLGSWSVSRVSI